MLNVGPAEVLIILVVALLVLGPKKLPEAARQIGKAMSEFRRVTSGLQDEVRHVLDDHVEPKAVDAALPLRDIDIDAPVLPQPEVPPVGNEADSPRTPPE